MSLTCAAEGLLIGWLWNAITTPPVEHYFPVKSTLVKVGKSFGFGENSDRSIL